MKDLELRAWPSFVDVVKKFLGNCRAEDFKELVEKLLKNLKNKGTNMNLSFFFYLAI